MATKTKSENTPKPADSTESATRKNGELTKEEHLARANRAMERAWASISRRQNKGD